MGLLTFTLRISEHTSQEKSTQGGLHGCTEPQVFVCVCVRACARACTRTGMRVCMCVRARACVCVQVCARVDLLGRPARPPGAERVDLRMQVAHLLLQPAPAAAAAADIRAVVGGK
jgi:hypothetical protein